MTNIADAVSDDTSFVAGGGEMGEIIRSIDWSKTALGPLTSWPQSLRTAVSVVLQSRFGMYIAWGREYVQIYNDGYRPILGRTKHPAGMGQPASECFRESWDIIGPMFDGVIAGQAVGSEDWLLPLDRNGYLEECYFTFSYSPIRIESGAVGGVLVTVSETTRRVLGERRLRTLSELATQTIAASTTDDACRLAGDALLGNPNDIPFAAVYLLDGQRARLTCAVSLEAGSAVCPQSISLEEASAPWPLAHALRSSVVCNGLRDRFGELPGGGDRALVVPLTHPSTDTPYGFLVAGITPRRELDDDYRSFLTLVAGSLSAAIANASARENERKQATMLAELDRAKTTFFGNVSHEFRTPLTLMLAPIQDLLAAPEGTPVDRPAVELLQRNALRLQKLVNTLLEFSRIEAGRVEASFEPVDLSRFTAEIASSFRAAIERVGLSFSVECPPLPEPVFVDREMWEKIVLNLLSNALKFTFEGSIAVRLHVDGDGVVLQVSDTGTGIAENDVPRLFERFHRIEGARSRSQEGSGIGLALIQELARLHGGQVTVESQAGKGTTFSVHVPRGSAHVPREREAAPRRQSTASIAAPFVAEAVRWGARSGEPAGSLLPPLRAGRGAERILFADDNADMRDYVSRLLGDRWQVEAVADGVAALESIRRNPPDLVLSDIMMPRLDGTALVAAVRADPAIRSIPFILLSARAGEEETEKGLSTGATDYIAKPFSARELLVRVAAALATSRVARDTQEAEIAQRENLYRHFTQAPFPVAVFKGPRHVVELANPMTLRAWGKGPEVIGLPLEQAVPELAGQPFIGLLDQVYRSGETFEGKEQPARLPTGPNGEIEEIYCNFVYAPLRDIAGNVEGVLLSAFIVTDQVVARRQVELALERAAAVAAELASTSQRLHAAQRAAHIGIISWDAQTQRVTWTPEIHSLMGIAPGSLEPTADASLRALVDEDGEGGMVALRTAADARAPHLEVELRIGQPQGKPRWVRLSAEIEYEATGKVTGLVGAVVDIQLLKEAASVQQRALEEAERASRAKDDFLATMSHELRTPLNAMLGWAKMLRSGALDQERLKHGLQVIERNAETQARLVGDLLDVSRIISGKLRLNVAKISVASAIVAAADVVRPAASSKGVELVVEMDPEIGAMVADADRLQQVVWNLLSNAVKFTPAGGRVTAEARRADSAVMIRVSDTGAGIVAEELPVIFERFHQIDSSTTRKHGGLGLGLAIVRHLVEAHGGTVAAQSEGLGKGTTFVVTLPLRAVYTPDGEEVRPSPLPARAAAHGTEQRDEPLRGARVLVVDDEPDSLEMLRVVLEDHGAKVSTAISAPDALTALTREEFDVLISDIGMPEMDGYALLRRLRASDVGVPAIALTAYARPEDRQRALDAGFQEHAVKPVDATALLASVTHHLRARPH